MALTEAQRSKCGLVLALLFLLPALGFGIEDAARNPCSEKSFLGEAHIPCWIQTFCKFFSWAVCLLMNVVALFRLEQTRALAQSRMSHGLFFLISIAISTLTGFSSPDELKGAFLSLAFILWGWLMDVSLNLEIKFDFLLVNTCISHSYFLGISKAYPSKWWMMMYPLSIYLHLKCYGEFRQPEIVPPPQPADALSVQKEIRLSKAGIALAICVSLVGGGLSMYDMWKYGCSEESHLSCALQKGFRIGSILVCVVADALAFHFMERIRQMELAYHHSKTAHAAFFLLSISISTMTGYSSPIKMNGVYHSLLFVLWGWLNDVSLNLKTKTDLLMTTTVITHSFILELCKQDMGLWWTIVLPVCIYLPLKYLGNWMESLRQNLHFIPVPNAEIQMGAVL